MPLSPNSHSHLAEWNTVRGWLFACIPNLFLAVSMLLSGCAKPAPAISAKPMSDEHAAAPQRQDADVNALFIGNSHTGYHDLPELVGRLMEFSHPETSVLAVQFAIQFLEDAAQNPSCKAAIESRNWKYVILQAQKISMSGRYEYSTQEGIDLAKLAKSQGATVCYYSEWGRKGVADEGERTHKIYETMAKVAEVGVAPVGRAWDIALSERPDMKLHGPDGNHQSAIGAFLTACVLCGQLTGESPASLASFDYPGVNATDRKFLAEAAARALNPKTEPELPK